MAVWFISPHEALCCLQRSFGLIVIGLVICNFSFLTTLQCSLLRSRLSECHATLSGERCVTFRKTATCATSYNFQSEFVCLASNFNTKVKCVVFSFLQWLRAICRSSSRSSQFTHGRLWHYWGTVLYSHFFLVCLLRAHTSAFVFSRVSSFMR